MFSWFRSKPTCPVSADQREWIEGRWNWLTEQFGKERLRNAEVILPRPEFFPDPFDHRWEDVEPMLRRICDYMDIDSDSIELNFFENRNPVYDGKFKNGAAGLYQSDDTCYRIGIDVALLADPLALAATLTHEVAHIHLLGHGRLSEEEDDHEPTTDLLTVFLGLGILTANSVIRERTWRAGNTEGWQMGRQGYLGMNDYGYALARFAIDRGELSPGWLGEVRLDVRHAFKQAFRLLTES